MIFQIVPKLSYDSLKEHRREIKAQKMREMNEQMQNETKKEKLEPIASPQEVLLQAEKLRNLQKRIEAQSGNNEKTINFYKGKKVMYGSPIQLRHVDSGMYLQYAKKCSQIDRTCQQIELVNQPSAQRVTFYIQQRYKYRQDGEAVVYNDHIILYNIKYNCYIHISEDFIQQQNTQEKEANKKNPSKYRPLSPLRRPNPNEIYQMLEANCSENFYRWRVICYRQNEDPQIRRQYIYSGDIIRMKHAETSGYLCFDEHNKKPDNASKKAAYVRIYKGMDQFDKITTNSLFEIEAHNFTKMETVQNQGIGLMWKQQGLAQTCTVRLRHLNSGKLLSINMVEKQQNTNMIGQKPKKTMVFTLDENITSQEINQRLEKIAEIEVKNFSNSNFNLLNDPEFKLLSAGIKPHQVLEIENSITETDLRVKNLSVVKIMNLMYNVTISTEIKKLEGDEQIEEDDDIGDAIAESISQQQYSEVAMTDNTFAEQQNKEMEEQTKHETDEGKFTEQMVDEADNLIINSTKLIKVGSMDDVYIFEKVDQEQIEAILFIHSSVPKIKEFVYNLRYNKNLLTSPYMKKFEELLAGLIFFVVQTDSTDPFKCEGFVRQANQKYLREIKIIDLLIDILIYPFESVDGQPPFCDLDQLTQKSPMTRVCQLIYRLLKHCVKDNRLNKFYVAQWISHFFHQSMSTTETNNLMADSTIKEILHNNKTLLDKQINDVVIKNIVENCAKAKKNDQFLNLLASLCSCNGESISSNQDDICNQLLSDDDGGHPELLIKVKKKPGPGAPKRYVAIFDDPECLNEEGKPLELDVENIYSYFLEKGDLRLYNYFQAMTNLLSLMCMQRNYNGITQLEHIYTIDFCLDYFFNVNVPKKLRANLAKILITMHIDKDPLQKIPLPTMTRVWQEIAQANTSLPQPKGQINPKLFRLKEFAVEYFIATNGIQRSYDVDTNLLTMEVLNILEKMLELGFYTNESEIISVINPVISLLNGSNDYSTREEEEAQNIYMEEQKKKEEQGKKMSSLDEPPKRDKSQRYNISPENIIIFDIKKKIIEILHQVIDMQNDIRLTRFLMNYYSSDNQLMLNPIESGPEMYFLQNILTGCQIEEDEQEMKDKCEEKVIGWMKNSFANKSLDMRSKSEEDLVCILMDIILYQDSVMVNNAFTLLARYFSQKRSIIEYANEVQLLQDEQEVAILKKVAQELREMQQEAENSEFWMGKNEKDELKKASVFVSKLEMLTELCIFNPDRVVDIDEKKKKKDDEDDEDDGELQDEEENDFLNLSELLQDWDNEDPKVCDDDEVNDEKNQRLLRNQNAHQIPMIIIRQHGIDSAQDKNSYLRVLEKCYIFLIKFVRNNSENQQVLLQYLEEYLEDMEFGVHAWELICEIFRNSNHLLTFNLVPLFKKAIKMIDMLPKETQKKTILLSFLIYYMKNGQNTVPKNQYLICIEVTSSIRKNLDHLFVGEQGEKDLELYMVEMKSSYAEFMKDERFLQEIQIPPELCYTIEYIKLLGQCGEGKTNSTESICSDKIPLNDLIKNLQIADFCYPLKSSLIYFMDTVYLEIEKDVTDENINKMFAVMEIICQDIEKFLEVQQRQKSKGGNTIGAKRIGIVEQADDNPENIQVDICKNFNMLTAFGSFPLTTIMEKYVFEVCFPAIMHYFDLRLPIKQNQHEFLVKLFTVIQKAVNFAKKPIHFENSKNLFKGIKKYPSLKPFGGDNLSNKLLSQYLMNNDNSQKVKKSGEDMMIGMPNLSQAQKLKAYLMSVGTSEKLIGEFETEFEVIVEYILKIKHKTEKAFGGTNTLDVKELVQSLIIVSDVNQDIDSNLRIICLKVLRKVVEMENKNLTTPASEWDSDDWSLFEEEIKQQQDMLVDLGVVNLLSNLLAFETKLLIKEESILVSIAVLLGGNPKSQNKFFEYICQDSGNNLILSLRNIIYDALEFIKKTQLKRNEIRLKLSQLDIKLTELRAQIEHKPTKQLRLELQKTEEQKRVLEDDLTTTDYDDSENPATYTTNELTVKRAIDISQKTLRTLQLLCENHNINLQNTLRQQLNEDGKQKINSFDIASFLSKNLEQFQNVLNNQTFDCCNQLVDTLIEMIQGPCKLNQRSLVSAKIIDSCREYLAGYENDLEHLGFEEEDDYEDIGGFKKSIVTLLTSLLEGEIDMEIIGRMSISLDFHMIKNRMLLVFKRFAEKLLKVNEIECVKDVPLVKLDNKLQKDSFDDSVAEAFEIFNLMHTLADSIQIAADHLNKETFTQDQWKAFEFIRSHTGRIEINVDGNLQRMYYPIRPVCGFVSIQAKKNLMVNVCRDSQQTKVRDLLAAVPDLIDEMNHNEELSRATLQITPKKLMYLKDFSTLIGLIINLTYLLNASRKYHYRELDVEDWVIDTIEIFGYIQGTSSLILIFFFIINKANLIIKKKWRDFVQENSQWQEIIQNDDRLEIEEMSFEMTHMILICKGPEAAEFNLAEERNFGNWFTWSEYQLLNIYFFAQDATFQYYVLYFGISMLGKQSSDIYYSFHLLDVIQRSPTLINVMKAITQNISQVSLTGLLMMIIIYIYTSVTFFYMQDVMYDYDINAYDSDIVGENNCLSMFQCFVTMLDKGMRNGGGIGDATIPIHYNDVNEKYMFKLVHDASFQIIVNIICLNIIFGIIVNSFATLRDQKSKNDEDMHNVCYICNFERLIFDKNSEGGFERHIQKDHNLWEYVFYIVHLKTKDTSDYTGIESYVQEKLEEEEYSWIPRQKALCLQNMNENDEQDQANIELRQQMETWHKRISNCVKTMDEVRQKIAKKEKQKDANKKK